MKKDFENAHHFCSHNRNALKTDTIYGCFYCLRTFNPAEIIDWWDDDNTATCPYCGIDFAIGGNSGFPITKPFLKGMHEKWFN